MTVSDPVPRVADMDETTVTTVDRGPRQVARRARIPARAEQIFALLANWMIVALLLRISDHARRPVSERHQDPSMNLAHPREVVR